MLETLYKGYLKLFKLDGKWTFVSRKDDPLITGNNKPDAVVIVARDNNGRLLVIRENRPVVGGYIWALPAGLVDDGETIQEAAKREIKEETGLDLTINHTHPYTLNTFSSPGMSDEKVCIVTGQVEGNLSSEFQENDEDITPYLLSPDDMLRYKLDNPKTPMSIWLALILMGT